MGPVHSFTETIGTRTGTPQTGGTMISLFCSVTKMKQQIAASSMRRPWSHVNQTPREQAVRWLSQHIFCLHLVQLHTAVSVCIVSSLIESFTSQCLLMEHKVRFLWKDHVCKFSSCTTQDAARNFKIITILMVCLQEENIAKCIARQ